MNIQVSIVIVCMNNLKNLYPCLESIKKYTTVTYECFVVAFMFSDENLLKLRKDYAWVKIIESKELRGFSENNNLALREAKGKYCFVVNDDTYSDQDVIGELVKTIENLPDEVSIISPVTLNKDGSVQRNGKPRYNLYTFILSFFKLLPYYDKHSKYTNKSGVYQSYNITGACFLIKTNDFKDVGWFDERYYFCPEDIALSTTLNEVGKKCYVNADVKITHTGGGTWSKIQTATMPASEKGSFIFFCGNDLINKIVFLLVSWTFHFLYGISWLIMSKVKKTERNITMYKAHFNTLLSVGADLTAKEIFIKYYTRLKNEK